eukprot:TRINITY_DN52443_c0_g1_i1.p1 TRINITY_DN52443_c0_g1~~TRINITY_DN52443_c0_g1_i1.p1  ORF type:complete len:988 (+),score=102.38 TRINITY_DN52443_c0_g1_i1:348-2966(+)
MATSMNNGGGGGGGENSINNREQQGSEKDHPQLYRTHVSASRGYQRATIIYQSCYVRADLRTKPPSVQNYQNFQQQQIQNSPPRQQQEQLTPPTNNHGLPPSMGTHSFTTAPRQEQLAMMLRGSTATAIPGVRLAPPETDPELPPPTTTGPAPHVLPTTATTTVENTQTTHFQVPHSTPTETTPTLAVPASSGNGGSPTRAPLISAPATVQPISPSTTQHTTSPQQQNMSSTSSPSTQTTNNTNQTDTLTVPAEEAFGRSSGTSTQFGLASNSDTVQAPMYTETPTSASGNAGSPTRLQPSVSANENGKSPLQSPSTANEEYGLLGKHIQALLKAAQEEDDKSPAKVVTAEQIVFPEGEGSNRNSGVSADREKSITPCDFKHEEAFLQGMFAGSFMTDEMRQQTTNGDVSVGGNGNGNPLGMEMSPNSQRSSSPFNMLAAFSESEFKPKLCANPRYATVKPRYMEWHASWLDTAQKLGTSQITNQSTNGNGTPTRPRPQTTSPSAAAHHHQYQNSPSAGTYASKQGARSKTPPTTRRSPTPTRPYTTPTRKRGVNHQGSYIAANNNTSHATPPSTGTATSNSTLGTPQQLFHQDQSSVMITSSSSCTTTCCTTSSCCGGGSCCGVAQNCMMMPGGPALGCGGMGPGGGTGGGGGCCGAQQQAPISVGIGGCLQCGCMTQLHFECGRRNQQQQQHPTQPRSTTPRSARNGSPSCTLRPKHTKKELTVPISPRFHTAGRAEARERDLLSRSMNSNHQPSVASRQTITPTRSRTPTMTNRAHGQTSTTRPITPNRTSNSPSTRRSKSPAISCGGSSSSSNSSKYAHVRSKYKEAPEVALQREHKLILEKLARLSPSPNANAPLHNPAPQRQAPMY